ncbi:MAG: efflux RND transporter permease subunit [Candidatus Cloacimonetes bacterium]|nr:efflux RND transporter permease subunit [Candidatus Cloacimonadota bacterium]
MFLAKLSVKRPVLVAMLVLVFVVFGALAYNNIPVNLMPAREIPFVNITTSFPGAGPIEVEQQVTILIEDAVSTLSGISSIESFSLDNTSMITVTFTLGTDIRVAAQQIRDRLAGIVNNLPTDARAPVVGTFDFNIAPVVRLILSGEEDSRDLFQYADTTLRDRFSQINGVALVDVSGGQEREIHVILDMHDAHANMVSLSQISRIIADNNLNMPSGNLSAGNRILSIRMVGQIDDIHSIGNLEIPTPNGSRRLSDIARIIDTGAELTTRTIFFDNTTGMRDENVIRIDLIPNTDGNPIQIAGAVHRQMRGIRAAMPSGMHLSIITDRSIFIESSVNDTMGNIFMGVLLTGLLLFLFLGDIRSTLIVAIAMPISIISTFLLMDAANFSLNMMSLLGLATSVGILVINSIVVLENIFRYKDMGYGKKESAEKGTSEIAVAVMASTLTNLVVFIPIANMGGRVGPLFTEFGLTVAFATIFSLLVAFTLTPMLASLILPEKTYYGRIATFVNRVMGWFEKAYIKTLEAVMKNKIRSGFLMGVMALLFVFSLSIYNKIGLEFMPLMDEGDIDILVELPIGYNLDETTSVIDEIQRIVALNPEVLHINSNIGNLGRGDRGMHLARTSIKLVDHAEREITTQQVVDKLIRDLADVPNAKIRVEAQTAMRFGGGGNSFTIRLTGLESERMIEISYEIMDRIRDIPGLINLDTTTRPGRPELVIEPKRDQLALTGVTVRDIGTGARAAVEGLISSQFKEVSNEYNIRVTLDEEAYRTPERLRNLTIMTPQGRFQMSQLADIHFTEGINRIIRRDKAKMIMISGGPATGIPLGDITTEVNNRLRGLQLPDGYAVRLGGGAEMMSEAMDEMMRAFMLAILLLYMLLAATLESLKQPLLIMSTIPLALIGVFFVQYMTGLTMNVMSMMAIIMLIGIVVNNAIIILDFANMLVREEKKPLKEALLTACSVKLKAILMTNIAIMLAMLPMALGMGDAGRELRQSIGVVSIGGLLMSTVLSLYVIPALSFLTERKKVI